MPVRVLSITDQAEFGRLLEHHLSTFMNDVELVAHSPTQQGRLHESFVAAGYELVFVDGPALAEQAEAWLRDLTARPGFPPVLFFVGPGQDVPHGLQASLSALPRERFANREFASAVRAGLERRKRETSPLSVRQELEKRYRFGDVTIRGQRFIKDLGAGGTSKVYLAESERAGAIVVLKVLSHNPDTAASTEGYDRFLQEYELLADLRHPNVVRIYDFGVADDHAYIAMEYFPSGDLRRRMSAPLTVQDALNYVDQIARALSAVHQLGVMHRDLKPGNIMLRADDSLALIDFGVAKELLGDNDLTAAGTIFGTPYYMSPEQGHGEEMDERSDLYSLGVMFYEMLTLKRPYSGTTPMGVIYLHRNAPLPELPAQLSWLEPVVHRLMAKQPKHRYQSAAELISSLSLMRLMAASAVQ
ncbi:MAG: serine/threonine-protein kinase [Steroidobacteraceae bacterium]